MMRFAKMQGVGNDFVVILEQDSPSKNFASLAVKLCERKFSVGADGLLVIGPRSGTSSFSFRMFNPDGSEDMCGNGLRCAALWAFRHGLVSLGSFSAATKDGPRECVLISADEKNAVVRVNMGAPRFTPSELPAAGVSAEKMVDYPISVFDKVFLSTVVNTGSTHTTVFVDHPIEDLPFLRYSPTFENLPLFPERTSVLWTTQTAANSFSMRIWERGAGETLGCGTGACAAAVAAIVNGFADRGSKITVTSKGGALEIEWTDTIWMTGPAALVFEGTV